MSAVEVRVNRDPELPPGTIAISSALARELGELRPGDGVVAPDGPRTVIAVRPGAGVEAWTDAGGSGPHAAGPRAADRLRVHRTAADAPPGEGWHRVHHTPLGGEPLPLPAFEWLRARGAASVIEDVGWRQDHPGLAAVAAETRGRGRRPGPAWRYGSAHPEVGPGRIRDGLETLAFVLGFDLRVAPDGVRLGLAHRRPVEAWSAGEPTTSAAFRQGEPAPGGLHDPALFGDWRGPRLAHLSLPWRMLPRHLAPWVAELVDRAEPDLLEEVAQNGVEWLLGELDRALDRRLPRPVSLDGEPLRAADFLWSELPLVPATFRQPGSQDGRRLPHGLDGPLHQVVAAVRQRRKVGPQPPDVERELYRRVQEALDAHLTGLAAAEGWGWSVLVDLQEALRVDGVMLDWGGQAVALVDPGRDRVGLPRPLCDLLLDPDRPEAVLLVRMPDGVTVARPEPIDEPVIRLPEAVARALHARGGELVRVLAAVSAPAQDELEALADGLALPPMASRAGWLDDLAEAPVEEAAWTLVSAAMAGRIDPGLGPVAQRVTASAAPPSRATDAEEVERARRAAALVMLRLGPDGGLRPPASAEDLAASGPLLPEVAAWFGWHDGQEPGSPPVATWDGTDWTLSPLARSEEGVGIARSADGRRVVVDGAGVVREGGRRVANTLGRWLVELALSGRRDGAPAG